MVCQKVQINPALSLSPFLQNSNQASNIEGGPFSIGQLKDINMNLYMKKTSPPNAACQHMLLLS